jgi:phage head maturation protease
MVRDAAGRAVLERFQPGAFREYLRSGATELNLQHDQTITIARTGDAGRLGSLRLQDGPGELRMTATLPPGRAFDKALELVRDGSTAEVSVEFNSVAEQRAGDQRTVTAAELPAIGIVDAGAYGGGGAVVEVRRAGRQLVGAIPFVKRLACECSGPDCHFAEFAPGSLAPAPGSDVLAVAGDFSRPLGSVSRGTVELLPAEQEMIVMVNLSDTAEARRLLDAYEAAGVYLRPYLDRGAAEFTKAGDLARYSRAPIRAIIAGATDKTEGWEAAKLRDRRSADPAARPDRRRRVWL